MYQLTIGLIFLLLSLPVQAGDSRYDTLSASTLTVTSGNISDQPVQHLIQSKTWLATMSQRLEKFIPDPQERNEFLNTVLYEATRAGLDPQLVLSLIQVESGFKKYAVSKAGARGYMQIMPFWTDTIGTESHNLFHLRINLRYGCTILRHYLDIENGNYFRALGRYNGSLNKATYPEKIFNTWRKKWVYLAPKDEYEKRRPLNTDAFLAKTN